MLTEQSNPNTRNIDQLSTQEILERINDEDAKIAASVRQALPAITQAVDGIVTRLQDGGRLIYVGAGTSGRLGVLDAVECVPTYGTPAGLVVGLIAGGESALTQSIEGAEDQPEQGKADLLKIKVVRHDTVVGIAASGRTPYVLGAIEAAKKLGALTVGVACNDPSPLLDSVEVPIAIPVGPEVIAGSTRMKAGTAQKMVLNMLSTATMIRMGKVYGNLMVDVKATNEKLKQRAEGLVAAMTGLSQTDARDLLVIAGYDVKIAVVMQRKQVAADVAGDLLARVDGRLRDVVGDI